MFIQNFGNRVSLIQKQSYLGPKLVSTYTSLSLIENNFQFIPRLFTITTNNGTYKFNVDILKDASETISKQLEADPNILEYHINISDDKNIMKKFEDIFLGLSVTFEFDELIHIRQIIKILAIENCPIYFKPDLSKCIFNIPSKIEIELEKESLLKFFTSLPNNFTIKTNNKEYHCSEIGVLSSKVIRDLKATNPEIHEFTFDFEDENNEFEAISNLFNFLTIQITIDNMNSLKMISEELQIEPIMNSIDKFVDSYENSVQLIDDKKVIIETIDEIFELLHNIQKLTVQSVTTSILHSFWVKTDENVQELVACIFQTVRIGYKLHPYLIELVASLNESSNDKNKLNIFLPYLVNQLKFNFLKTPFYSSFYLKLAQKGLIDMDEALDNAMTIVMNAKKDKIVYTNDEIVNVLQFFLPELFEKHQNDIDFYNIQIAVKNATFFKKFFPSNVEDYKKMRDSGIPVDDISRAIYMDDVDKLQSIVSKRGISINECQIVPTIFDIYQFTESLSLIDYSVMHGSIKCFKYLLLNHAEMSELTLVLSIYGGNSEIIRLVDHNEPHIRFLKYQQNQNHQYFSFSNQISNSYFIYGAPYLANIFSPAIMNHQNDLFDWIFENKHNELEKTPLLDIAFIAVQNGNAHALIRCIDKGLDIHANSNNFLSFLINEACNDGFYRILQLIISFCQGRIPQNCIQYDQIFNAGNISIYNLLNNKFNMLMNQNLCFFLNPLKQNNNKFIMTVINDSKFVPNNSNLFKTIFSIVIKNKNIVLFNFLIDKFTLERITSLYADSFDIFYLLKKSCKAGFFEAVKVLTEFILSQNPLSDFTASFYSAVCSKQKEIYNFLLEKNVKISLKQNDPNLYAITQVDNDVCIKLLEKIDPNIKDDVLCEIFNLAVIKGNKNLVELLLDKSRLNRSTLINAVQSSNLEIVNIILGIKSDPSFINMVHKNGTALNVAVQNNSIEIVKRLLSLPDINTFLYDSDDCTPFITAISNFNIEMIDVFVEYYGDQISSQIWQINKSFQNLLKMLSKSNQSAKKNSIMLNNDDQYDDEDDNGYCNESLQLVSLFDVKSTFIIKKKKMFDTITKLSQFENVDLNCHYSSYTLLSYACEVNDFELLNFLLKSRKVNVNAYSPLTGNTPLMVAVLNDNSHIAQILIENDQTDINHRNFKDQSAITIAASKENEFIMQSIVHNERFDFELSALYDAYFTSTKKINKMLLKLKNFDVNTKMKTQNYIELFNSMNNQNDIALQQLHNPYQIDFSYFLQIPFITPLIKAVLDLQEEMIDLIVSHPSFNKEKSCYVDAIFASVFMDDIDIFRKLLALFGDDVNLIGSNGYSLLFFSIYMRTSRITTEILASNSFDSEKSQIVSSFMKAGLFIGSKTIRINKSKQININTFVPSFGTPRIGLPNNNNMAAAAAAFGIPGGVGGVGGVGVPLPFMQILALNAQMNELLDFDEIHDNLIRINEFLPSGRTFFTSINPYLQNIQAVISILIARGADPNLPDRNGLYPIEYACQQNNQNFITAMIALNNIDLSIKSAGNSYASKGDTILHMVIPFDFSIVIENILNMPNLDLINQENENGDTPLLIACKYSNIRTIMSLFAKDNLDYKHRNKEGNDALDIVKNLANTNFNSQYGFGGWAGNNMIQLEPENIEPEEKREYFQKIIAFFK